MAKQIISLGKNLVLREVYRTVDRVRDIMSVTLSIEPLYGVTYTPDLAAKIQQQVIVVQKSITSLRWSQMKNATQQEMVQLVHGYLSGYYQVYLAFISWKASPRYDEVENNIPNGDPLKIMVPFPPTANISLPEPPQAPLRGYEVPLATDDQVLPL